MEPQTPSFPVAIGAGSHPFPFRTRKLSLLPPMVLPAQVGGRVGRCRGLITEARPFTRTGFFFFWPFFQTGRRHTPCSVSHMLNCSASFIVIVVFSVVASACSSSPTSPSAAPSASTPTSLALQLDGTWTLTSIQPAGQPREDRPDGAAYTVSFADGRLSTRADCNVCSGAYSISGATIVAGPALACTRAACPTMTFESAYTALLSGDSTTAISGNSLTLSSARGVLTFTR